MNRIHASSMILAAAALTPGLTAQQDRPEVTIEAIRAADNVYMLKGQGGNIGLSIGEDGAFLIDDQFAPLTEKILAAVGELTDEPVRFVVNTHWHGDHTGGNENLGKTGAILVAHENVRQRLSTEQFIQFFDRKVEPSPEEALPVITFADSLTFHWNDDVLRIVHVGPAHTDGDSFIHFRNANVVHTGDLYFARGYPFIDTSSGGSLAGVIDAADRILAVVNDRTSIIPGHGPLSNARELRAYRDMLKTAHDRVRKLVDEGRSRDEVIAARPTGDLDAEWGTGFLDADCWVGIVYDGMVR